ncbi:hypothetical protein B0H11DRAFT_2184184 [Mycena galericulata]|nr:hypothetical protein B0H11DRAFT_2184184 [Mycena galericulata]
MSQPIPRPRWTPTKVKNCNQTQLLAAMGWDAGAFKLFRKLIQTRGDILGLDTRDEFKAQDPHKFQKLVDECVDAFPALKNFTGYWPVEVYWNKYTNWRIKKKNNERKANGDPNTAPTQSNPVPKNSNASQESSSNSKISRKRKERDESEKENETTYPNTAPTQSNPVPKNWNDSQESSSNSKNSRKRKERDESEKEDETTSTPPNPSQGASERTKQHPPLQRPSQGDVAPRIGRIATSKLASRDEASSSSSQLSTITSTLSSSPSVPPSSQPRSSLPVTKSKLRASWRACVLCGYRPRVPDAQAVEIKACFHDRDDLQHILATIGVVADNHLRALLRLPQRKSESFLSTLVHETLDATEKVEIFDMLGTYVENKKRAANRGRRDNKIQFTEIPRPPPGLVNVLSRNKGMHSYVKKHMKIAGDEEYFEFVEFIEAKIPKFLDVSKTYEEQQEDDIEAVVRSCIQLIDTGRPQCPGSKPTRGPAQHAAPGAQFEPNCEPSTRNAQFTSTRPRVPSSKSPFRRGPPRVRRRALDRL